MQQLTRNHITSTKAQVKLVLDDACGPQSSKRVAYAIKQIKSMQDCTEPSKVLERIVFIISALVADEKARTLSHSQVDNLRTLARDLLVFLNIPRKGSRLSVLHCELNIIYGQIIRRRGQHLQSAWEQRLALQWSGKGNQNQQVFHRLTMANRLLRLGDAIGALDGFREVADMDLGEHNRNVALFGQVKALRLAGILGEAKKLQQKLVDDTSDHRLARDLQWEAWCLESQENGNPKEIVVGVKRGSLHYQASFVLEASMWTRATQSTAWNPRLNRLSTLFRDKDLKMSAKDPWYKAVKVIEDSYDVETPFDYRLEQLGKAMSLGEQQLTIDKELLFLAAASRWLVRSRVFDLALVCANRYAQLCFSLSRGASPDTLGLITDILENNWNTGHSRLKNAG